MFIRLLHGLQSINGGTPILIKVSTAAEQYIYDILPSERVSMANRKTVFEIVLRPGYHYQVGDFIPDREDLCTISEDGTKLYVISPEDAEITVIQLSEPQQWMGTAPTAVPVDDGVQPTDIPHDGTIQSMKLSDVKLDNWFNYILVDNKATRITTTNSTQYTNVCTSDTMTMNFTWTAGYDYHDVYWKTYDGGTEEYSKSMQCSDPNVVMTWNEAHTQLTLSNITKDISIGMKVNPVYENPYTPSAEFIETDTRISSMVESYWFAVCRLSMVHNVGNYVSITSPSLSGGTYNLIATLDAGAGSGAYILSFKNGYDFDDITVSSESPEISVTTDTTNNRILVSGITQDAVLTMDKNDANKKFFTPSSDTVEYATTINGMSNAYQFVYVKISNTISTIVTFDSLSKTTDIGGTIRFKATFAEGYDTRDAEATSGGTWVTENNNVYLEFSGLNTDITSTVKEKPREITPLTEDTGIEYTSELYGMNKTDRFNYCFIYNQATSIIDVPGTQYTQDIGTTNSTIYNVTYTSGHNSGDVLVSCTDPDLVPVLTNATLTIPAITRDTKVYLRPINIFQPWVDPDTDLLGLFNGTAGFEPGDMGQYYVFEGDGTVISSYGYITDQLPILSDRRIWCIDGATMDVLDYDTTQTPGEVESSLLREHSDSTEVASNLTINQVTMTKHVVTLRYQITTEPGKFYLFKVRDFGGNYSAFTKIAIKDGSTRMNLVNMASEMHYDSTERKWYFSWNSPSKFVYAADMAIYFEINNIPI